MDAALATSVPTETEAQHPPITLTLNDIRKHSPCHEGWTKLLKHLGKTKAEDEPLNLLTVLDSNGLDDTLWCFQCLDESYDNWARLVVCDLVEPALQHTDDPRPFEAIKCAREFALGNASRGQLNAASATAWDAARDAASATAWDAARAAARAAAWDAAWADAWDAARDAARAAARDDARDDARDAAWDAARSEQETIVRTALIRGRHV
jgi:hypothetical protein